MRINVIVPAHNEEGTIAHVIEDLKRLKRQGVISEFAIVNDHSTDRTGTLASQLGARVIPQNVSETCGKGEAFLTGALWAKNQGAEILVVLDADLKPSFNLNAFHIQNLTRPLVNQPDLDMVIHPSLEGGPDLALHLKETAMPFSGQRAIRLAALNFLFRTTNSAKDTFEFSSSGSACRFRQFSSGYALEHYLNKILPSSLSLRREQVGSIETLIAGRGNALDLPKTFTKQFQDIARFNKLWSARQARLASLRANRL